MRQALKILLCAALMAAMAATASAEMQIGVDLNGVAGPETEFEGIPVWSEPAVDPEAPDLPELLAEDLLAENPPEVVEAAPRTGSDADFVIDKGCLTSYTGSGGNVVIPAGVTSIGEKAFSQCEGLTGVTIPEGVVSIGAEAFYNCINLSEVILPESLTVIKEWAFHCCDSLKTVTIPAGVGSIGYSAFGACSSLTAVNVAADNPAYVCVDGVLYTRDMQTLLCCPGMRTSLVIPDGVRVIDNGAAIECTKLVELSIPDGVSLIGFQAFSTCEALKRLDLPNSVTTIDACAFESCRSLTKVTIPDSVTTIGWSAFSSCTNLAGVYIGSGVATIEEAPFSWCSSLADIEVSPENRAFCSVDGVLYDAQGSTLVGFPTGRSSVYIPAGVTGIGESAFKGAVALTRVDIPEGVKSIGKYAFAGCGNLTRATIPSSVVDIGHHAFFLDDKLTLYGVPGSCAQTYAQGNNIPFSALGEESVTIAQGPSATLYAGQSLLLTAKVTGEDAAETLTWRSSRAKVATVTKKGLVKALSKGTATITVTTAGGGKAAIRITVPEAPSKVRLSKTKATVVIGGTLTLKPKLYPTAAKTAYTWKSSKKSVATVSASGVVKGVKQGTAVITVKTSNGKTASCKVTVPAGPRKIAFGKKSYSVKVGKKLTLKTTLTPATARTALTWSSSDKSVATVTKKGVVKGVKKGTATITVVTANGKRASVKVTVR